MSASPSYPRRLLVMDVDSTLITAEVIELLADHAGTRAKVTAVTEAAMRGELDFAESLQARVATLAGVPTGAFEEVLGRISFTPGAPELVATAHERGWVVGLVSGGFTEVVGPLADTLKIGRYRANRLEIEDGVLTGRTIGPIIDRAAKERTLREFAAELEIPMQCTVAIGDGANDLDMIGAAGIGIAFDAKPIVREQAPYAIEGRLDRALTLIDELDRG